jgi:hypothetical protein
VEADAGEIGRRDRTHVPAQAADTPEARQRRIIRRLLDLARGIIIISPLRIPPHA